MKKRFSLSLFFLLAVSFLLLAACGNEQGQEGADKPKNDLLAQVKKAGELRIGTEGTYPPFTFHDKSGKLTGFDVEIATEVAKRLGVKPVFMETQWDAMFAGLDAKRFDMIANEVGIRPDRQKKYDFSDPYITSAAVLVVHKDNNKISKFEDIKGLKAAQSMTSNYADLARSYGAQIVGVEGFNQAIELLGSKRVDATINDKLSVLDFLKQKPNAPIKIVATHSDASQSGFMFRKGSDTLVAAVNKALHDMMQDGTYAKISEKWFGQDVSK
ncbi:amino acid ABC transporter substrate-binding protein [Thermaerobacillus caldiproteolyticus]|uniref:Cystine transport system substrate-binding protein n=1 Tax=Thermaerobacillus caldiproteolyticus TaxID=247480 RepID=A0A7V9Z645_9BACL|nr:amino acid ABC transporter substrate-binding protein [Anoxybacillus caldiproteolyticus]MBA2874772.1 cystine transport system substrate-binding protein [Anoxybacillus caldiproteolyticus]